MCRRSSSFTVYFNMLEVVVMSVAFYCVDENFCVVEAVDVSLIPVHNHAFRDIVRFFYNC